MNVKPIGRVLKKPTCTWLSDADHNRLSALAEANGVTVAAYLRSIIVDALADEAARAILQTDGLRVSNTASCQVERI